MSLFLILFKINYKKDKVMYKKLYHLSLEEFNLWIQNQWTKLSLVILVDYQLCSLLKCGNGLVTMVCVPSLLHKRKTGFEPATPTMARWCSTTELLPHTARRLPTLARGVPLTTLGVTKLNFCVRNGNRCILRAIITALFNWDFILSKLDIIYFFHRKLTFSLLG